MYSLPDNIIINYKLWKHEELQAVQLCVKFVRASFTTLDLCHV